MGLVHFKNNEIEPIEPIINNLFEITFENIFYNKNINLKLLEEQLIEFNLDQLYMRFNLNYKKINNKITIIPYHEVLKCIDEKLKVTFKYFSKDGEVILSQDFEIRIVDIGEMFNCNYYDSSPTYLTVFFDDLS